MRWLGSTGLAAILAASGFIAGASATTEILKLRAGEHPGWTRFVADLSAGAGYSVTPAPIASGVIIAIAGSTWDPATAALSAGGRPGRGLISRMRAGVGDGGARIALDFSRPGRVRRSFLLKPMQGKPYRLVVDIEPIIAPAPGPSPPGPSPLALPLPRLAFNLITGPQPIAPPPSRPQAARMVVARKDEWAVENPFGPIPDAPKSGVAGSGRHPLFAGLTGEFSGNIESEGRLFPQSSRSPARRDSDLSLAIEPRYEIVSAGGDHVVTIAPFARLDLRDTKRTHFDIRELNWTGAFDGWEVVLGVDRVFWGVTESAHLVDIINQDDQVEDIDDEDRLGQPMAALSYSGDWGTLSAYLLPYFRERQFAGPKGRPGLPLAVDRARTQFESGTNNWHADWALRWSAALGPLDIGVSHFSGTDRTPRLLPGLDGTGQAVLVPRYDLIDQTSLDLQATLGPLLVKFEGVTVDGPLERHNAFAAGFEYTAFGLFGGAGDVGFLSEFLYDDRGAGGPSPFEQDLFAGLRWSANDVQGTTLLAGAIFDLDRSTKAVNIEASRRLGDRWRISLDVRLLVGAPPRDPLFAISRDDFIQLRIGRYF